MIMIIQLYHIFSIGKKHYKFYQKLHLIYFFIYNYKSLSMSKKQSHHVHKTGCLEPVLGFTKIHPKIFFTYCWKSI